MISYSSSEYELILEAKAKEAEFKAKEDQVNYEKDAACHIEKEEKNIRILGRKE